ncbi:heavy metal translocating P-type ATPase [Herbaspirillum sp. YR522]|uniref:heavy metal translocating P-type ATPase n=1 Tax=Herbaspirillum sp. YR522 TaxID=1144342 RepID=UPI00026FAB67|nr:heavy metal translocating P-type ATPase [Herbaspirillum sp. YR522]EJM97916.1 heavy metal translocating P-type ATPase [Herbaspirillum sp. YR522]
MSQHQHQHDHSHDHGHDHPHAHNCCTGHGEQAMPQARTLSGANERAVFFIQNMDCPTEERLIRERLVDMQGVGALEFNLIQRELTVRHQLPSIAPLVATLTALDMLPAVKSDSLDADAGRDQVADYRIPMRRWLMLGAAGVAALAAEILAWTSGDESSLAVIALAVLAIALGGLGTLKKGWIALRNFSLNMNFLMSLAVIGAALIGQWPEAAVVIVLFTLAEMIEALSLDRARNAIAGLMAMAPDTASVQQADGSWQSVAASTLQRGARVRVAPGERLAADGIVVSGTTSINQAPITGESIPVAKAPGDQVFAGTINEHGAIELDVTTAQADSTLSRIVASVQQAQGQRAPTQRFVDRFAQVYIPAVVALALAVAVLPPLVMGVPFYPWIYKALVLLVIACPCALVISTPVTVVSGLAAAARNGILVKGGVYLEQGRKLRALALDKTGTLTHGRPAVTDIATLDAGADADALMQLAVSLAARSDHPVSRAIAATAADGTARREVDQFEALAGRGVKGVIDGQAWHLGNHRLVHELGHCSAALEARLQALEQQGKSTTVLCREGQPELVIAVADTLRPTSGDAVAELRRLGVHVTMLSGDNQHTARAIGNQTGIDDARGDQLPSDKEQAIQQLAAEHGVVGMVGDGINDAPALARAQIGFAMGAAGADTALETADVALMDDDLRKIGDFLRLSRKTHAVLVQNIVVALGIKAVFMALALAGMSSLWMAVFADMGASLIVVFNGLRLVRGVPRSTSA